MAGSGGEAEGVAWGARGSKVKDRASEVIGQREGPRGDDCGRSCVYAMASCSLVPMSD